MLIYSFKKNSYKLRFNMDININDSQSDIYDYEFLDFNNNIVIYRGYIKYYKCN
jgi:hypothetical protein